MTKIIKINIDNKSEQLKEITYKKKEIIECKREENDNINKIETEINDLKEQEKSLNHRKSTNEYKVLYYCKQAKHNKIFSIATGAFALFLFFLAVDFTLYGNLELLAIVDALIALANGFISFQYHKSYKQNKDKTYELGNKINSDSEEIIKVNSLILELLEKLENVKKNSLLKQKYDELKELYIKLNSIDEPVMSETDLEPKKEMEENIKQEENTKSIEKPKVKVLTKPDKK